MSDGLPTEEQLRRIQRGVRDRIDARRRAVRSIAGATAGVLVLAGGIALLGPLALHSASSGAGSAAGTSGGSSGGDRSSALIAVRCHGDDGITKAEAPDEPERIAAACGRTAAHGEAAPAASSAASGAASAAPARRPGVICRAADGVLDVYPAGDRPTTLCERRGLQPY